MPHLAQLCRAGAPVIFGVFASSDLDAVGRADLRHAGADAGQPCGAASSRAGSACRSAPAAALCASKIPDAQAAYESAKTLLPTLLAGTNFVLHAAGWLEGGLASSYEKFVMDADQLGMMQTLAEGVDLSENGQALDAIREVGPGSHYLGCAHTQANFETAFYRSSIADNNSYEQWLAEGEQDAAQRANTLWKRMLHEYEAPALDPAIDEALLAFVNGRKAAEPDSNV